VEGKDGVKTYTARHIIIATGGRPQAINIPGAEYAINSDHALDLPDVPKKIVIVGGGYIGLEFACIFQNFGADVHLMYRGALPLRGFDYECREFLAEQLRVKGMR
jgi:glutathione reductase (NADPH)